MRGLGSTNKIANFAAFPGQFAIRWQRLSLALAEDLDSVLSPLRSRAQVTIRRLPVLFRGVID